MAKANDFYLFFLSLFITSLVVSNLIFQKFFHLNFFGINFELSVGIIFYPVTFLVTDVVSEIFGKQKANKMVITGIYASIFCLVIISLANLVPSTTWSPVNDSTFKLVLETLFFKKTSMIAYLCAQLIDIRIYHFWKKLTKGKHLWLRNNCSTIFSQLIDTFLIIFLLCFGGAIEWNKFGQLFFYMDLSLK